MDGQCKIVDAWEVKHFHVLHFSHYCWCNKNDMDKCSSLKFMNVSSSYYKIAIMI